MTGAAHARIRDLSTRAAAAKIAQAVGEIVMGESTEAVERDWTRRYLTYWVTAFAYFSALQLAGNDRNAAREIVLQSEIQEEIRTRVETMIATLTVSQ